MDNSVQELRFLDLTGLPEHDQTAIKGYLHADQQLEKLSWGTPYSAPVENNAVETTIEHYAVAPILPPPSDGPPPLPHPIYLQTQYYSDGPQCHWATPPLTDERVNGADDNCVSVEPLAAAAAVDAKPLPAPVQELSPNDVTLVPAHQHLDPGGTGSHVTVAPAAPGVSHGPQHHPQDYHAAGLSPAPHALPTNMYMSPYGMAPAPHGNMGYPIQYGYQGQQPPLMPRGRSRKSTGKICSEQTMYNQEAPMLMMVDYQNQYYTQPMPQVYYGDPQGSEYYNNPYGQPYTMMSFNPPYTPSMPPYTEPAATKGPPDNKKGYSYYQNVQPKHEMPMKPVHSKSEEKMEHVREFKPGGVDNRSKPLDRTKPPQGALKITKFDTYKKPATAAVKIESPQCVNATTAQDDKSSNNAQSRTTRPATRVPPPGRHSTSRQPSQEPTINSPPHVQKMFPIPPSVQPTASIPVPIASTPVPAVVIPITQPVPVTGLPPGIAVLPGPPPVVTAPPSVPHPAVPLESLPEAGVVVPGAPPHSVALSIPVTPGTPVQPVLPELDVELQCGGPVGASPTAPPPPVVLPSATVSPAPSCVPLAQSPAQPSAQPLPGPPSVLPAAPPVVSAPIPAPAPVTPAPVTPAPKGAGPSDIPQPSPAPAAVATYASRLGGSAGSAPANKTPVSPGEKPTLHVKPFSNAEESELKSQCAVPPKPSLPQDKYSSQPPKPPANAMKVTRRQDASRKPLSAVVKNESTDNVQTPPASTHTAPPFLPAVSSETPSDGAGNRPPAVPSSALPPRTQTRFQNSETSQPHSQQSVHSPLPGSAPLQAKPPSGSSPGIATAASDGPLPQTPGAAAKQPTAAPVEVSAASPAAPASRSYARAVSRKSAQFSPADTNSVDTRYKPTAQVRPFSNNDPSEGKTHYSNQESDSLAREHKKSSAPVSKPMSAPPLPSLSKDPELFRLGDHLSKYKLNHSSSSLQPRGLSNRGNWCYIHATLQALLACPPFYNLMRSLPQFYNPKDCSPSESCTPIIDSIMKFIQEFPRLKRADRNARAREENASATVPDVPVGAAFEPTYVYKMLSTIRSDTFKVEGRQEDAEEFLSCLLNGLHDEMFELIKMVAAKNSESGLANGDVATNADLSQDEGDWSEMGPKKKKTVVRRLDFGRTPLSDIFRGRLRSCVYRDQTHSHTHNVQPFFTLQLDIEKAKSVNEALELYGTKDQLEGVTCAKTKKEVTAWQQVELEDLPPVLLLHLKCFDYKMDGCSKICRVVEYPMDLKVQTKSNCATSKGGKSSKTYKLFAVVYHDGKEATKGHYVADAFHLGYNQWLRYDDSTVMVVRQDEVLHARLPRVPYLLYYRRQDTFNS